MVSEGAASGPVLDLGAALARLGGDRLLFSELVTIALEDLPKLEAELCVAVRDGNAAVVRAKAHALKGLVASCGGERAAAGAQMLEDAGESGDLGRAAETLDTLRVELAEVTRALGRYR